MYAKLSELFQLSNFLCTFEAFYELSELLTQNFQSFSNYRGFYVKLQAFMQNWKLFFLQNEKLFL